LKKLTYLSAEEEDIAKIAQANIPMDDKGNFIEDRIVSRQTGDFPILDKNEVEYMDVAPNQIVGLSASLIPFLEHDDANRALMGSNMQRQAVPLIRPEMPIVGTGLEAKRHAMREFKFTQKVKALLNMLMRTKFMFVTKETKYKN